MTTSEPVRILWFSLPNEGERILECTQCGPLGVAFTPEDTKALAVAHLSQCHRPVKT